MSIELDHIYICLSEDEFDRLKDIYIDKYGASHSIHSSTESSWEGLYLYSQQGFYIEILRESSTCILGQVGVALSDRGQFSKFEDFKERTEFKHGLVKDEKGEDWFEYLTVRGEEDFSFYSWWMKYPEAQKPKRFNTHGKHKIVEFKNITVGIGSKGIAQRGQYLPICPHELLEGSELITFQESITPWITFEVIE